MSDLFIIGSYTFIDFKHGGSLKGMVSGVDNVTSLAADDARIIAGHGPLGSKVDLERYRDMLAEAYQRLNTLKITGKSAEEAVAEKPLADFEEEWGDGLFTGERWIEIIYPGV